MAVEIRTVHFTIDPALRAYLAWLDAEGVAFSLEGFDLFAAGYRAREAEECGVADLGAEQPEPARPADGG